MEKLVGMSLVALVISLLVVGAVPADDLSPVTRYPSPAHEPITLVAGGVVRASIVAPDKPGPLLRGALTDLQLHLERMTGAKLAIGAAPVPGLASVKVVVAPEDETLFPRALGPEGFAVRTGPEGVTLAGQDEAGAAWAIYDFLERALGVRWYWPDPAPGDWSGTYVPRRDTVTLAPAHWTDAPFFRMRYMYPPMVFQQRLRSYNSWPTQLIVHAPHRWDTLYQETRPQIFQLRADGGRDFGMLCYGNPATLQTYLEQIEKQLADPPKDRLLAILNGRAVTVSPGDMAVTCNCPDCRRLWNPEGGSYGTASKVMGAFVAALAREVKARWPELTVIFLPYKNYTLAPEGIEFPDNVEIQICGMPGIAQYKEPAINAAEQANIDAWIRLSGRRIQNWHYSCWPEDRTKAAYLYPHVLSAHYRANREKTVGSFINGVTNHWPRQHVSLYVWLKTLWDPDFDADAAIEGFVTRMYGPAAGPMRELVAMQARGWEDSRWPGGTFSPKAVYEVSYPRAEVQRMEHLLTQAFEAAQGDELVTRRLNYVAPALREFFAQSAEYASGAGLRTLSLWQVGEDPKIDGKLDDPQWRDVEALAFVQAQDREHPEPKYPTTVQAVWTREGVTFGFRMAEPEPEKLARDIGGDARDASLIWWNDNVEIFLDVTGDRTDYYQLIVNANGSIADFHAKDDSWTAAGLKAAAFVGEDHWSLEVFVPYAAFPEAKRPATGVVWYGNFTRHRVTDRTAREYQRLNTRFAGPSNDQNAFGPLPFVER